jgi:serine/threonine protein kinase
MAHAELQSQVGRGTRSHMAPELLLEGRYSKATDIYAFGITLWEIFTCCIPYDGIPAVALGKMVVYDGLRLDFPPDTPPRLRRLIERCWQVDPASRPSFDHILRELTHMSDQTLGSRSNVRLRSRELPSTSQSFGIPDELVAKMLPPLEESPRTSQT